MSCQVEIRVTDTEITVDTTRELCNFSGITLLRPIYFDQSLSVALLKKLGSPGRAFVKACFIEGVTSLELSPYYARIKIGRLFDIEPIHRAVHDFIVSNWDDVEIKGDTPLVSREFDGFEITSGPSREEILRILDGSCPPDDPRGWLPLEFKGHLPSSGEELTLLMRFGSLVGRRMGNSKQVTEEFPYREYEQGERIVWDMFPGGGLFIGPETTMDERNTNLVPPGSRVFYNMYVRYHDATGTGLVLSED